MAAIDFDQQWPLIKETFDDDQNPTFQMMEEIINKGNLKQINDVKEFIKVKGNLFDEELTKEMTKNCLINDNNQEIFEELLNIKGTQKIVITQIIPQLEENFHLCDQFFINLTYESTEALINLISKEKGNEGRIIVILKLLSKLSFEKLSNDEKNILKNCIIHTNNKLIIHLGCSVLRKDPDNVEVYIELMKNGNDFVGQTAADELFAECLDEGVLVKIRNVLLNGIPPVCERVQDIIVSVLQANNPSVKSLERIKIALELSRYNHLHDLRDYILHVVKDASLQLNEVIGACFEVLSKKLSYQNELVESIRFVLERLIPVNNQLNPRIFHLKFNNEFIVVYCRETANEFVKRINKNGVVVAFGDVVQGTTPMEDVGLKDGDEIEIDESVQYEFESINSMSLLDSSSIENEVSQLINGNVVGKLKLLEVLPYIKQKFEPSYIPYKCYFYLKEKKDTNDLLQDLLLFDIEDISNKDAFEVYCKLLLTLGEDCRKTIIETKCECDIPANSLGFIYQLIITPGLHSVIPIDIWKLVPQIVGQLQGNTKHSFCFNSIRLFKDNSDFVDMIIELKDVVMVSMLLNQNPTPVIIQKSRMVYEIYKDNDQKQKELKERNELDYYYSFIKFYSPNPDEILEYIKNTVSPRRRWILLSSLKTVHNHDEIVRINNTISYDGMNSFDFAGFYNPSNLCYMNSVLVQLLSIDEFQVALRQTSCKSRIVLLLISALRYFTKNGEEFKVENLVTELQKYTQMKLNTFNDVSEFMLLLWNVLEQELPKEEFHELEQHFTFTSKKQLNDSIKEEKHMFLIIPYGMKSIEEYIIERTEELKCIEEYPNYLQIQFQRSLFNTNITNWKNTDEISFGYSIELPLKNGEKEKYVLKGVIVHFGTVEIGHYISYVLNPQNNQDWICFNDQSVNRISWYNFNIQQKCFGKKDSRENVSTAYILIYQKESKLNKNINQVFNFVSEIHPFDVALPNQMADKFFAFSVQANLKIEDIRILNCLQKYMFDVRNYQIVTKMIKLLASGSPIVRKNVLQMFLNYHHSVKHIDFRFVAIVVHYVSSYYSMFFPSPTIHLAEFVSYLNVFCEGDDVEINSFRRTIIKYATKSLGQLNMDPHSKTDDGIEKLFYHLIGVSQPTIEDINQDYQILRCVLTTDGGSKIIKNLYQNLLLKLAFVIKQCFACDEEEMYRELIDMILNSEDKKAIFSLLSIYSEENRSSVNKPLPEAFCYGLLTLIEPTRHGMNVINQILKCKNPIVSECLEKMYGSYDLFKTVIRKYANSLDESLKTFQDAKLKMYDLGYSDIYDKCSLH